MSDRENFLAMRRLGIGSSDSAAILGRSPYATPFKIWEEKLGLRESFEGNWATERGNRLEPQARACFELEFGDDFKPVFATHSSYEFIRSSLDGYNSKEDIVLEIKCPSAKLHEDAKMGKIADHYWIQIQHQLLTTNSKKAIYYSYDGASGIAVDVFPNYAFQQELLEKEIAFWELVKTKTPPPLCDKDFVELTDDEPLSIAEQYAEIQKEIKDLEKKAQDLKSNLVKFCEHAKTKIGNVQVLRQVRAGSIDYSKIKELEGVDVEVFRKPSTSFYTIKVGKNEHNN